MIQSDELSRSYERDLRAYLGRPSEEGLAAAYEDGRRGLAEGVGLVSFGEMHGEIYAQLAQEADFGPAETSLSAGFFAEALAPYEMAFRGYRDASEVLRSANEQLERVNLIKTRFFNHLNHELRTPLNAILGFADLLGIERVGPLNDLQRHYADNIWSSGRQMLHLVNQMLDVALLDAGQMQMAHEEVDLVAIIQSAMEKTGSIASRSGVELEFVPPPEIWTMGDSQRLLQVFVNIIGNAVHFTPAGGRVTIATVVSEYSVGAVVTDEGAGIPEDKLVAIFDEFEQSEMAEAAAPLSTGLGLPLTRRLLELMNGSISARNAAGKGTTFAITIPRELAASAAALRYAGQR